MGMLLTEACKCFLQTYKGKLLTESWFFFNSEPIPEVWIFFCIFVFFFRRFKSYKTFFILQQPCSQTHVHRFVPTIMQILCRFFRLPPMSHQLLVGTWPVVAIAIQDLPLFLGRGRRRTGVAFKSVWHCDRLPKIIIHSNYGTKPHNYVPILAAGRCCSG